MSFLILVPFLSGLALVGLTTLLITRPNSKVRLQLTRAYNRHTLQVPLEKRLQWADLGLRIPSLRVQRFMYELLRTPFETDHIDSIIPVKKEHWAGSWIINKVHQRQKGSTDALVYAEETAREAPLLMMFIHGGGFTFGFSTQYMPTFLKMIESFQAHHGIHDVRILSMDYSRSPEATYPKALNECMEGYRYLVEDCRVDPTRIILAGDGAGANLASVMLLESKARRLPYPAMSVLLSPWGALDDICDTTSATRPPPKDCIQSVHLKQYARWYLPVPTAPTKKTCDSTHRDEDLLMTMKDIPISPSYGQFEDIPTRFFFAYSASERLADQQRAWSEKLVDQCGATVYCAPSADGCLHNWIMDRIPNRDDSTWIQGIEQVTRWCAAAKSLGQISQ